jgi:hypothetical protein
MANSLFLAYKQESLGDAAGPGHGTVDWEADDIRLILLDNADDDPAVNTDQDLADIVAGARVATSANLASKTAVAASNTLTLDHADTTLATVTGDQSESILYYKHTGTESTSLLICEFDTASSGLPVTPNGGDIIIAPNASGLFAW